MKHFTLETQRWAYSLFLSLFFKFSCLSASAAVTYCAPSVFGYSTATGGGSATPTLVSSVSQLQSALNKGKNKVIIITKDLTFTSMLSVQDGSNVTLLGLPGVKLISLQQDKSTSGILFVKRFNNLIIRNLTFVGPGAYDCDGNDLLCFEKVTNAWVDHCDFQDGCDGNFDNKSLTDDVTVSWCRFRYLKKPKAGGSGGSDDHRFTNLLGSSDSDAPSDGKYNFTWAYCWWDEGCKERMVRCRNAELHFLNCYWNSSVANYYVGSYNTKAYFEGCTFEGKANTSKNIFKSYGGTNACKFVDCSGNLPSNSGSVSAPTYSYTASGRAEAKTAVTNATCGAGATLTVTTAGAVSSTCDGGAPLPTVYTVTWNATANGGSCGTASTQVTAGAAIGTLPEATKDEYNFDGWYTAPSGGDLISAATTVTGNVTYYAQFTSAPVTVYYTVIWDANGGTCATSSSEVLSGSAIGTLPTASKTGDYDFDGWYTAINGGTKIGASTIVSGNVTYYAHYTATGGGGGGTGDCSITLTHFGKQYRTSAPRLGFAYAGSTSGTKFIIESDDSNTKNIDNDSSAIRLNYSKSLKVLGPGATTDIEDSLFTGVTQISFKWKLYNTSSDVTTTVDVLVGGTKVGSAIELTGKNSDGFQTKTISSIASLNGAVKIINTGSGNSNKHLHLDDISITYSCSGGSSTPTFTLSYDENGGSGEPMADQTGTALTVAANTYTAPTGYSFQKWNTAGNGGGADYAAGASITLTEDMTLYAIWQPNTYTVTLDAEGGSGGTTSVTATFDEALPNITVPAQSGYLFKGYYTGTGGTGMQYYDENGSSTSSWTIPDNTTLHAYWEAGSTPIVSGCDLHFWFIKEADAGANGLSNDGTVFSGMIANSNSLSGSLTIDGTSYSVTGRTGDPGDGVFGSFTIPTGYTGTFYALAVSSGGGDRQINIVGATTYELDVPGGSDSYKRIESEVLPEGTYSIQRDGNNVRLGVVVVKLCTALPASDAPTISGQPTGDTYCAGDAVVPLNVTANNSGSGGTLSYQWKKDGVNIPSANSETYAPTETGMYACVVTNEETGKSPTSLSSDVVEVIINGAVAAPTMSQTENTVTITTATAGATIYYTTDGTNPATTSASGTSVTITADCTVKAFAEKDGCASSVTSFNATFDPTTKECVVLVSYTLTASGTATPTIAADENNLVGGSADYKVSSTSQDGGYKLNSGQYFGLTLASGQFKAGDKVTVTITKVSDQGDKRLYLSTSKTGAAVLSIAQGDVVVGDNVFTLAADCDAIYVARNDDVAQNPFVKAISVCRELVKYTVTFDKNAAAATGTMTPQSFYSTIASKIKENTFALDGYDFAGWATSPSGSKVYDDEQSVTMTDNLTLYALWQEETFTLTNEVYPAGYGTVDVPSVGSIPSGAPTTIAANTYTVNGTTVTATPAATTAQYTYVFDSWSGIPTTVLANATVTANFTRTPRTYTVTLNTNGGTINAGNVTSYTFGVGATLPTDVTRTGSYDFAGWYDNSGFTGSPVTTIPDDATGDMEYWAKWISCPIAGSGETLYRFDVNSSVSDGNICSSGNNPRALTTPTELSTLIGGTLEGYITNNSSWNNLTFTSGRISYANNDRGVLILTLDCPIREGDLIRFNNYSSSNDKYNYLRHTSNSTTTDQLTLNASKSTTEIQQIVAPAAFVGKTELFIVPGARTTSISYFEVIRPCTLTLDAGTNGGMVGGNATQEILAANGDELALPHAFKNGYSFKGWYTAPSSGSLVSDPYTVGGSTTLYAQFEDCPHDGVMYKFEVGTGLINGAVTASGVAFEFTTANYLSSIVGGTLTTDGSAANKVTISGNSAITITDNSAYLKVDLDCEIRAGDVFKSTLNGNTVYVSKATSRTKTVELPKGTLTQTPIPAALVGEKTLYIWKGDGSSNALTYFEITRPKQTNITLNASGAYNKYTTSVVAMYGLAMPEVATLPLRTGYVFGGYYDAPDGAGTQYYNGLGVGVRNWDKDVINATLYAKWSVPCDLAPTLTQTVPVATIWDGKDVDMALVQLSCDFDTTGIQYSLVSASEAIPGCTFTYFDERIYIQGTPALGNTTTVTKTITFTMTNDCSSASTYTVTATIRIYPAGQKAKIAFIITGTKGGAFDAYETDDASSCNALVTYLSSYYDITYVNGYATKDETAIANYYKDYDLMVVTDFLDTGEGYTNALGTMIDKKPILSFEAYVANQSNWHIGSNPKDPHPKVTDMKILCAGHAIFGNAKYDPGDAEETVVVRPDTTVNVLSTLSSADKAKGLQGFTINEAPDFIFLATVRDADNNRDLIVCCERQVVFPARLLLYGINFYEMPNLSKPGKIIMKQMIDYLLMTDETKVADCSLVFDNGAGNPNPGGGNHLWNNPANWAPGYNIIPTPYHPTRIIAECWVNVDNAHAGSVKVNKGRDEHGNVVDGKLIVKPYGGLTVAGIVAKVNDTRYASPITIKAEDLLIEADATHNGAFVYGNKESDVRATVQYYSRGADANTTNPVWQYMGIPFQAGKTAINMYYKAWMCRWTESTTDGLGGLWQWVDNNDVLVPFEGYCITQDAKKTYTNAGKLNAPVTTVIPLDNRDADGFAFAANSWTAPIKIQEMQDEDFVNAERSIYIFHSGTYASWGTNKDNIINTDESAATPSPGQYVVIPIHSSPYLGADSVIPAMQGFFVKTTPGEDASLSLVYNRVVYDATYFKTSTQPMRAPRRTQSTPEVMVLNVIGNSYGDRVHLLSRSDFSDEYEDGWDGRKIEGDAAAPYLAVVKQAGEMAVASIAEYEGRNLSFRAGEDLEYTFTFNYEGDEIYLYDRETEQATLIRTGNTYSFSAVNKTPENRFLITANPPRTPTDLENTEYRIQNTEPKKFIYEDKLLIFYRGVIYDALGMPVKSGKEGTQ